MFTPKRPSMLLALPAVLLTVVTLARIDTPARADNPQQPNHEAVATEPGAAKFLRYVDNGKAGGRLETGVVTYKNKDGVKVTLVAAIHIGEKSYFEGLNKLFGDYDAVLYEMVKPKDANLVAPGAERAEAGGAKPGENSGVNMIHDLQKFMKDTLNLEYQLDVVDYTRPNFIHADMDRETFEKMQAQRGESFEMMFLQQMMSAMTKPAPDAGAADAGKGEDDLRTALKMLTRPDGERQIKALVAKQISHIEDAANGLSGPAGTVILAERNKVATKVLLKTIESGKKNIAVFYGAAHMPDLEDRLELMGFKPVSNQWRQAWDLTIRPDQPSAANKLIEGLLKGLGDDDDEK